MVSFPFLTVTHIEPSKFSHNNAESLIIFEMNEAQFHSK